MKYHLRTELFLIIAYIVIQGESGISNLKAQESSGSPPSENIKWQACPCTAKLGDLATISLPEGFGFTGREGAIRFMELSQNPSSGSELGVVVPQNGEWYVIFEFEDSGYVKDDEKDRLDADAILNSIRKGTEEANKIRLSKGWTPLTIQGWQRRPYYDTITHNLTWSIKAESQNEIVINHSVRLLGREGVMHADLVGDPQQLASAVPEFDSLLKGYYFNPGRRYAEFRKGDKMATYGLTALIAGGAGAVAAKTGLLAKFWKLIVAGIVLVGGALMRFFKAIFNRGVEKAPELPKQD